MKTFRKGGIHPPEHKRMAVPEVRRIVAGADISLMMSQSIGAPAKPVVKAGDRVERFQMIAEPGGFISAPVHSPVDGTVKSVGIVRNAQGYWDTAVTITPDSDASYDSDPSALMPPADMEAVNARLEALTAPEIIEVIGRAGIVGLGGATFPTKVKFMPPEGMHPDILIINGAECEPYLTCDDALMRLRPVEIVAGVRLLMKAAGVDRAVIGVEANKPEAIEALRTAASHYPAVCVQPLKVKYPQGGEKQLIKAVTGREVPSGALPVAVGAIVDNVATVYAVYEAVAYGKPLVERIITVAGRGVSGSGNFLVPFGVSMLQLAEAAGGFPADTGKILAGGPMMGRAVSHPEAPVVKGLSGIVALPEDQSHRVGQEPCIRCAACVSVCPMGLEPYLIERLVRAGEVERMRDADVMSCIECGSCNYTCPSGRPLLDRLRLGKRRVAALLRNARQDKK